MIQTHVKTHGIYHITLALLLILGVIVAYYVRDSKQLEMMILIGLASIYIVFGIVHHYLMHDLSLKIVIEYVAMATLGIAIAFFVFKGGMI